jgi:hypothetical protein
MRGRAISLSAPRRFLTDLLYFARRVPSVPVQRRMHLAEVAAARSSATNRPGWPALFLKAYARVAATMPELRRAYINLPWGRLYEYPVSVANVAVERDYYGEKAVFIGRIREPADLSLTEIEARLRELATAPFHEIRAFRKMLLFARLPWPLRRLLFWLGLNLPRSRTSHFGTFGLSVYSALGAESLHPLSPVTTLTYGVIDPDGTVYVRLVYDHRVLDGAMVARALARMEEELKGAICAELQTLAGPQQSSAAGDALQSKSNTRAA